MERPAGRPLTWSAEKLPAGNFLDFLFLQARGGPIGFQQASQAMRPEKPEAKVAGRQLGRSLIVMALLLPVLPRNLRAVYFSHLMTISSAQGQGKGVSSCIRILSDKARHEVVIITKHEGARSSSWWERLKMEVVCTARGSQEVAHLDFELKSLIQKFVARVRCA